MSELVTLVMEPRTKSGKGATGRLRRAGFTPCVFYGPELKESVTGSVNTTQVSRLLSARHWETMRISLKLPAGGEEMCIIREIQRHPLTGALVHIDFMRLLKDRKVTVNVPVRILGRETCPGIKDGGVLESLHEIEIETLPMSIPEYVDIDVSGLALGGMIHVRDLVLNEDLSVLADLDEVAVIVAVPRGVEESLGAGEEPKEVEVVAKGKAAKAEEAE
ncbi:MAG: 50S ribosomal protein L25 [Synergistaceae bacterium]|jgi:large subunit ribosomal protein L25|nr:50S ribosomal protein L25 [Synergistaceae bacterium]